MGNNFILPPPHWTTSSTTLYKVVPLLLWKISNVPFHILFSHSRQKKSNFTRQNTKTHVIVTKSKIHSSTVMASTSPASLAQSNIFFRLDCCFIAYHLPSVHSGNIKGFLNWSLSDLFKHKSDQISCCLNYFNGYSTLRPKPKSLTCPIGLCVAWTFSLSASSSHYSLPWFSQTSFSSLN